jgi:hypothetical protein
MGHCIRAIVTSRDVADQLRALYPQLPLVTARQGYVILPVDDHFLDSVTESRPPQSTATFMLQTNTFCNLLVELSRLGTLAYIETDYFGGNGAQRAAVFREGKVAMEPEWRKSGVINRALKLIGVKRGLLGDRFAALGLPEYRSNDHLVDTADRAKS